MDPLKHVHPAEPLVIQAETWNRLIDTARQREADPRRTSGPAPVDADGWRPAVVIRARNNAEATIPPHAILTPAAEVLSPADAPLDARRRPVIAVATPASGDDPIVIAFESIAYQALGRVVVAGVTVAKVSITDTGHRYARPVPGDRTKLTSATSGPARLLVAPSGTGEQMVYVVLGAPAAGASPDAIIAGSETTNFAYLATATGSWADTLNVIDLAAEGLYLISYGVAGIGTITSPPIGGESATLYARLRNSAGSVIGQSAGIVLDVRVVDIISRGNLARSFYYYAPPGGDQLTLQIRQNLHSATGSLALTTSEPGMYADYLLFGTVGYDVFPGDGLGGGSYP
ncbi:MAG TPA: hypothetical protein VGE74_30025 [Gemmata sp.]